MTAPVLIEAGTRVIAEILLTLDEVASSFSEDSGSTELKAFLADGGEVNGRTTSGSTLLHIACEHMNIDLIRLLVRSGAEIDARDADGQCPAHIAVDIDIDSVNQANYQAGPTDVSFTTTLELVRLGANLSLQDQNGKSARDWASEYSPELRTRLDMLIADAG